MKHNILIALLIWGIIQFVALIAWSETIRMGYFEIRPHIYTSAITGRPAGAVVTHFERVAKRMGCDVVWIGPLPHARLVHYLEKGDVIDGDPIMSMTSERKKFLYYPRNSFYHAKPNFVVKKNNPLTKIDAVDDVKGYVVGQFSKAANSEFVLENKTFFKFDIVAGGKILFEQQLKKLIAGRVDAIHTLDEFSLMYEAKRLKMAEQIKILFLPEPSVPFYSVFCRNEKGRILADKYDVAVNESGYTPDKYNELIQGEFDLLEKNMRIQTIDGKPSDRVTR